MRGRLAKAMYKLTRQNVMQKLVETNIQLWRQQTAKQPS
jgi:polar amino acid transport system substrate-binding protein